ncbi:MAG: hypothetical protein WBA17_15295 [Saprospiraceae bacterium]
MRILFLTILVAMCWCFPGLTISAQETAETAAEEYQLLTPFDRFSKKETTYVTLQDGTELSGRIKDFDRKKGQVKYVKLIGDDGQTYKLKSNELKQMYVQPTAFQKLGALAQRISDAKSWSRDIDADIINRGYVLLEATPVRLGKKTKSLLLQVLNPNFSNGAKVYHDVFAKSTAGLGIGGITVVGGDEKSYYFKKAGDEAAYRLKKKDYKRDYAVIFSDCPTIATMDNVKWTDFAKHVQLYGQECVK